MTEIRAIETSYAGCRFRSRLEARWAVFFDHLGITWEYEPQGFLIDNWDGDPWQYLPDFYLPRDDTYVEVKGTAPDKHYLEMLSMGIDYSGPLARGLLLLGPIPDVTNLSTVLHSHVAWYKGVQHERVMFTRTGIQPYRGPNWQWIGGENVSGPDWPQSASWDAHPIPVVRGEFQLPHAVRGAYNAARSARFEHGETGGSPAWARGLRPDDIVAVVRHTTKEPG